METNNKELQKTITRGILKAQLIGIAISIGITIVLGFILASYAKKATTVTEPNN